MQKIIDLEPQTKKEKQTKEYIIIASLTGMRYQSMLDSSGKQIEFNNQNNKEFIFVEVKQDKTNTDNIVPLMNEAKKIIIENNFVFPNFNNVSLMTINRRICILLQNLGIENYDKFSSHNMRSTFITNLSIKGMNENTISLITHPVRKDKTKSTWIYNRSTNLQKAVMFFDEVNRINLVTKSEIYTF